MSRAEALAHLDKAANWIHGEYCSRAACGAICRDTTTAIAVIERELREADLIAAR